MTSVAFQSRTRTANASWLVEFLRLAFVFAGFLYFLLPGNLLLEFGWQYLGGGAAYQKIHIATYFLICISALILVADARFREAALAICFTDTNLIAFTICVAATAFFAIVVKGVSIAPFIDTFLAGIIVAVGCLSLPARYLRMYRLLLDVYFIVSIPMVFFEYYTKSSILYSYGLTDLGFFRATALFEGPLSAATLLGLYSLVTLISTPINFSASCLLRLALSFAAFSATFTTGSRTALLVALFVAVAYIFVSLADQLRRGRLNKAGMLYIGIAMPLAVIAFASFLSLGLFDAILARFEYDFGSAFSRQVALNLLFNMSESDLWFGLSANDVASLIIWQGELGLIAIEISWANFILVCGLIFTIPLFITFVMLLFRFLPKYCGFFVYLPSFYLLVLTAASNGIWSKTTILSTSFAIIISFLRKNEGIERRRKLKSPPINHAPIFSRAA